MPQLETGTLIGCMILAAILVGFVSTIVIVAKELYAAHLIGRAYAELAPEASRPLIIRDGDAIPPEARIGRLIAWTFVRRFPPNKPAWNLRKKLREFERRHGRLQRLVWGA